MKVLVEIYNGCKYKAASDVDSKVEYENVKGFDVVSDPMTVDQIEADGLVDDYHEYLILYFEDGDTATFRNSYVDLFKI